MEIWRDIAGYEGLYQISNKGNIKNLKKLLTPTDNGNGYLIIGLSKNGKRKNYYVHRLAASAFINNPDNKPVVNHKDHNIKNNNINNLEWVTQKENVNYSIKRMCHPKSITRTNTGEKYISYRASRGLYRVIINKKEYGTYKTLKEAIIKRDSIIKGGGKAWQSL